MAEKLSDAAIDEALTGLPGWSRSADAGSDEIVKWFELPSFPEAIAFVGRIAELAEAADHHPALDIRYRKVRVGLSTHDAGGLTRLDVDLAARIDATEHEGTA